MIRSRCPGLVACLVLFGLLACPALAQRKPGQPAGQANRNKPAPGKGAQGKPAAKPAPKPKSNLPSFEGARARIDLPKVDPNTRAAAQAAADRIDALILAKLRSAGIEPNATTDDDEFVRRVYLDIVGRIPTADEALAFIRASDPNKRARLIDRLLESPGYASHFYNYWADVLRLVDQPSNNVYLRPYNDWVKESFRQNKPYDVWVREMLTATGKPWENPATGYVLRDQGMPLDNLNNTVTIFLGTRIGCAQCHDHPFDRWTQKEFYELAAFTAGTMDRVPNQTTKGVTAPTTMKLAYNDIPADTKEGRTARRLYRLNRAGVWESPTRQLRYPHDYAYDNAKANDVARPGVIFGEVPPLGPGQSRREAFANWLASKENPRFARTIANRLWKRTFGIGLIEPVDDMKDDTVASNPELMAFLEDGMKRLDFDLREFQRGLFLTQAYQRKSTKVDVNPEQPYHFQGPVLRRMTAEQVWDSLMTLTVPQPDTIVRADDDAYVSIVDLDATTTRPQLMQKAKEFDALQAQLRQQRNQRTYRDPQNIGGAGIELARASELPQPLPDDHFLRQFGQSDREIIADSSTDGTVPQLLVLFNGPVTHMMLDGGSVMYGAVTSQKSVDDAIDVVFLSILGRRPNRTEKALAEKEVSARGAAGIGDVIWALLNTREFLFVQ